MSNRIKQNFYTVWGYDFQKIPKDQLDRLKNDEYWKDKKYWYVEKRLPNNRLYAGWGFRYPTKLTPADLPQDYIFLDNYKKCGYIRTAGVKDLIYHPSPFHNHAFKDDFLYISYTKSLGDTFEECDEYIFGDDIVEFIFAVEKYSPGIDVTNIKKRMVEQYNLYCDEMNESFNHGCKKIAHLEELRS